ncbi:MAG TPA: phosphoribosylaminoimidazolesuccinocarboxamide synthase [Leptospiraceae bacterium]|nr:phosphoribosylaminoimidazolesuccinocarboxamide synthase [Leptospiraceae bacterium]HMW07489.1 phosphoribosylaminoimidazolesuccinocarboxamide synthase [Leptospiraceae bacterium]HMX33103.1 phosphoribosylaminoimidazolesuccinocarboxamide synthase [Leptospiraceae bacterium]HMY33117.1 phosphoribosylaminoimidazolesuccinocarboxamide synthase [Leptospiraceae bacterium]HMZ64242.1 phosphoribosylaminoimidazolesuccinocarboxamide synthase [Leptospiraceae bacterium]
MKVAYKGKVRDVYDLGDYLILSSTDRISAFDCVFNEIVPDKGKILNNISTLWFKYFSDIPNHIVETDYNQFPGEYKGREELKDRSVLVKKCKRIDYECVVRGYLSGSAYKEYKSTGQIAGVDVSRKYQESEELSEPLFTPAIKNDTGHDENISEKDLKDKIGLELFTILKDYSMKLYLGGRERVKTEGLILCDTKFEFGFYNDKVILIDELLTPDSSRYWELNTYAIGSSPPSYDKQILRNYLEKIEWNKNPPPPKLPDSIINELILKYKELQGKIKRCLSEK